MIYFHTYIYIYTRSVFTGPELFTQTNKAICFLHIYIYIYINEALQESMKSDGLLASQACKRPLDAVVSYESADLTNSQPGRPRSKKINRVN